MNKKSYKNLERVIKKVSEYWFKLQSDYGIEDQVNILFYDTSFYEKHDEDIELIRNNYNGPKAMITTVSTCLGYNDPANDENPGENIIEAIRSHVYMSYQNLFELIIDCDMNYDDVLESMKYMLRHELGHIIVERKEYIGKKLSAWMERLEKLDEAYSNFPRGRKNASMENRWKGVLSYMNLPEEKAANEAVGITVEDIKANFDRTKGG